MQVLVVDDDPIWRHKIKSYLKLLDYDVLEASDGTTAWELIKHGPIRLVVTDWTMPEMEGTELIRRIRSSDQHSYTYIIILTGREGKDDLVAGLEAGADDFIVKPVDASELRARVAIGQRIIDLESRLNASMARLEILASHDYLTGLLNRRALYSRLKEEIQRAARGVSPVSIAWLDIDHFKKVNDEYGHLVGDEALIHLARIIEQDSRGYDWAARWGGEEFLLVLPGNSMRDAKAVAERVCTRVATSQIRIENGKTMKITVSVGVASTENGDTHSLDDLLQRADAALFEAKRHGRNRVHVEELNSPLATQAEDGSSEQVND